MKTLLEKILDESLSYNELCEIRSNNSLRNNINNNLTEKLEEEEDLRFIYNQIRREDSQLSKIMKGNSSVYCCCFKKHDEIYYTYKEIQKRFEDKMIIRIPSNVTGNVYVINKQSHP